MSLEAFSTIRGTAIPVPGADIDTDRIIPARFLKCVTFDDLAGQMFWDERFHPDGSSKNHPIDDTRYTGATILLCGPNFGCGSSREHAPQTIRRSGIRAIVAGSFAEIFFGNSTGIGLPCVCADKAAIASLIETVQSQPETVIDVDLVNLKLTATTPDGQPVASFPLTMPESARHPLTEGKWDAIAGLLANRDKIIALEATLPQRPAVTA